MENLSHKSGVYCLIVREEKIIYIGSSKNLSKRRAIHKYSIKIKDHQRGCSRIIESSEKGYKVIFKVLELCENYEEREQFWINFYNTSKDLELINVFDAERKNSAITKEFRDKMSDIRKEKWKDSNYREERLKSLLKTSFTSEDLSKKVHVFTKNGDYISTYYSAKEASEVLELSQSSVSSASRGKYRNLFLHKNRIFVYNEVLYKLDELLETHQELRAISSEAWETCKSTKNVQRLTSEQSKQ